MRQSAAHAARSRFPSAWSRPWADSISRRFASAASIEKFARTLSSAFAASFTCDLIRALSSTGRQGKFAGQPGHYAQRYFRRCRRAAGPNVEFLGHRTSEELQRWYTRSAVHVAPSWYETPGIASLEAASCGCRIVVTPGGCTREYFGDEAEYCRRDDPASIRGAVDRAFARSTNTGVRERIADEFTWDVVAEKTLEGYEMAFKRVNRE
jgi:glycosyltransferase involved in cell wall biosynthesis